jgi:hypothetical protein
MGKLEKRSFSKKHETLIKPDDPRAKIVFNRLQRGLKKGNFINRNSESTKWTFRFDSVYG